MLLGDNGSNIKNYLYLDISAKPAYIKCEACFASIAAPHSGLWKLRIMPRF